MGRTDDVVSRSYDVFFSFASADRDRTRVLVEVLRQGGLTVFFDEDNVRHFEGISSQIEQALHASRVVVAYYSARYPASPACQFELTAAFLAGQREGDPSRRLVVVNPEPNADHLQPAEVKDARYSLPPGDRSQLAAFVSRVQARVEATSGPLTGVTRERPRWFAHRVPGAAGFVGRYREQWQLHSALHAGDLPLTHDLSCGPVVALAGLPGAGKTAMAAAYAWRFGAAFCGGVHWISLAGATPGTDPGTDDHRRGAEGPDVLAHYADQVRAHAEMLRIPVAGISRRRLFGEVAEHLAARPEPSLWIVDDVPPGLDPELVHELVLPAGSTVRTVLITQRTSPQSVVPVVVLGPMLEADARSLLYRYRQPEDDDREVPADDDLPAGHSPDGDAVHRVITRLDGHALALTLAGRHLRDRQGLTSYRDLAAGLDTGSDELARAADLMRSTVTDLEPLERAVLRLAVTLAPAPIPARLVHGVLTILGLHPRPSREQTGSALARLADRLIATRTDTGWQIHQIALAAARDHLAEGPPPEAIAQAAAEQLVALTDDDLPAADQAGLVPHAWLLATRTDLGPDLAEALQRWLADRYRTRGEPAAAARMRDQLASRRPGSAPELLAAAEAHQVAGSYERALEYGEQALSILTHQDGPGEPDLIRPAHQVCVEALDALGRFDQAEAHWARLTAHLEAPAGAPGPLDVVGVRLTRARGLRRRGQLVPARQQVQAVITELEAQATPAHLDLLQAARIELARIQLAGDQQRQARLTAQSVVDHYRDRGLPQHHHALEAQEVLATAWLTLHLWELHPDPNDWKEAERALGELHEEYRRRYGSTHLRTLTTAVEHAFALVSLGRPVPAERELIPLADSIAHRLSTRHPLHLRTSFLRGQARAQQGEYAGARDLYAIAYEGQRRALGPAHPDTLHSQYGLAVGLIMTGDRSRGVALLREVRRAAPTSVGRATDLYGQTNAALLASALPGWLWRLIDRSTR